MSQDAIGAGFELKREAPMPPETPRKTIIEETQEICTLCGGRGQELSSGQTSSTLQTCRHCQGVGYIVTKRVTRTEIQNVP
jgi:DnaJ-class molecular chaperone